MYRERKRVELRKYNREYNKRWRAKNGYHNEINSKERYPEKEKARYQLLKAVNRGEVVKLGCEVCRRIDTQAHHDDYSKPLKVRWLCPLHHTEIHRKSYPHRPLDMIRQ